MRMDVSEVHAFFKSSAFDGWRKNREAEQKIQGALIGRMDGVIRAIGFLGQALSR